MARLPGGYTRFGVDVDEDYVYECQGCDDPIVVDDEVIRADYGNVDESGVHTTNFGAIFHEDCFHAWVDARGDL